MKEIPLIDPSRNVRAWMCSACERVSESREMASSCCVCRCGKEVPKGNLCEDCRQVETERLAADMERYAAMQKVREESLGKSADKSSANELADEISRISEENYCAGWLSGIEEMLWDVVNGREVEGLRLPQESVNKLRKLNHESGGWWCWSGKVLVFVTTEEWSEMLKSRP